MKIRIIKIETTIIDVTHPSVILEVMDDMGKMHEIAFVPAVLEDVAAAMSNVKFGTMNNNKFLDSLMEDMDDQTP